MKFIYSIAGKVFKTDLFKVSAWTSLSTFMRMLSGFVSIKVAANLIGPSGIALVGHFVNVINIVTTLGTGGIGVGVTKYVAEYYDEPDKQSSILAHSLRITLLCSLIMSLFLIVFSRSLGHYIFQTYEYTELIVFFGITVTLYALNALFLSILNGFKSYKKFVILNIILSAVTLAISVSLVYFLGVYGALLNCILSQSLVVVITFLYLKNESWVRHLYSKIEWDSEVIKKLAGFAGIVFTSAILAPLSQLIVRKYISESLSTDTAGIWESMNRLSSMYLVFITSTLSVFYLPKLAEIKDALGLRLEILKTLKMLTPVMFFICLTIYFLRGYVISIVFSKEFMSMYNLFAIQLTGDFLKITIWIISYQLIAKAMIKKFIATEIIFHVLFVLFSILGCYYGGIYYCILFGYTFTYLVYSLMIIYLFRKTLFLPQTP